MQTYDPTEQSIQAYITKRTGVSSRDARQVLMAAAEFISYHLIKRRAVSLPYVGRWVIKKRAVRDKLFFTPSESLRLSVNHQEPLAVVGDLRAADEALKKKEERADSYIMRLKGLKSNPLRGMADVIKLHLLSYLQNDFVWGRPWKHPITKDVFTACEIQQALLQLKTLDGQAYRVLFILWMSLKERRKKASELGLTERRLHRHWNKALDRLLLLILLPELNSNTIEILNPKKDGSRDTEPAKSSKRNGVYRATRVSNKVTPGATTEPDGTGHTWGVGGDYWARQNLI